MKRTFSSDLNARREMLAQTVMISTASRRELETMCIQLGVPYDRQPSATLRQALKQRLINVTETQ